jgi:hypothetical protein
MNKAVLVGVTLLIPALSATSQAAAPRYACPGENAVLANGPEQGAPVRITAKEHMRCTGVRSAIASGTWTSPPAAKTSARYRFTTPGFECRILKASGFNGPGLGGESFRCKGGRRSFKFFWVS